MGIDVWEVIEAAKTKPFGFMPFYPGPGLGGHCIPIDPFYLTWKAREFEVPVRFIELAGEINTAMPGIVVDHIAAALDARLGKGLNGARILIVGLAYKKNVDDMRESPALQVIELLEKRGATTGLSRPVHPCDWLLPQAWRPRRPAFRAARCRNGRGISTRWRSSPIMTGLPGTTWWAPPRLSSIRATPRKNVAEQSRPHRQGVTAEIDANSRFCLEPRHNV